MERPDEVGWAGVLPTDLIARCESELRAMARAMLAGERPDHTLQPTALVNELWLRTAMGRAQEGCRFTSRAAFMAYAAKCIRSILVDHARRRGAQKRGGQRGGQPGGPSEGPGGSPSGGGDGPGQSGGGQERVRRVDISIVSDSPSPVTTPPPWTLLELEEELRRLEKEDPRCATVFEMRFFGGASPAMIAETLQVSVRTVGQDWAFARAWLADRLGDATTWSEPSDARLTQPATTAPNEPDAGHRRSTDEDQGALRRSRRR